MRERIRLLAVGMVACLAVTGCAGWSPVRWPSRELWAARPVEYAGIRMLNRDVTSYRNRLEQQEVSVAAFLLGPEQAREQVHVELLRDRIQPLMIVVRNDSDQTYTFRKSDVDSRYLPAREAAKGAQIHPVVHAARVTRWIIWLLPGVLFNAVIEPSTGLPFPGMDEIASRPPTPRNREVAEDFLRNEIPDGQIGPHESVSGLMFIRPPRLWSTLPIKLVNARTQEPLVFGISTRPAVTRVYPKPYAAAWDLVSDTAAHLAPWTVTSADRQTGVLALKRGGHFFGWSDVATVNVLLKPVDERRTQVTVESPPRPARSIWCGVRGQEIDRAMAEFLAPLDATFAPKKSPKRRRASSTNRSTANVPPPSEAAEPGPAEPAPDRDGAIHGSSAP